MQDKPNTCTQNKLQAFHITFQIMKYNDMQVAIKAKSCAAFGLMIFVEIKFDMIYIFRVSFYLMVF